MKDADKSREQLEREIEDLRARLDEGQTSFGGLTRRDALVAWIAPVLLSVPCIARSTPAHRRAEPTRAPSPRPTAVVPTVVSPTMMAPPTASPTPVSPTMVQPPSPRPTAVAPTTAAPAD